MVNRYKPHIDVIPEDDANRKIANALFLSWGLDPYRYSVLPPADGWMHVIESFTRNHCKRMRSYPERFVVLLIDFDDDPSRLEFAKSRISADVSDRVFIFGVLSEPERLKPRFGNFDDIGDALGRDCRDGTSLAWTDDLLKINAGELERFRTVVCPKLLNP